MTLKLIVPTLVSWSAPLHIFTNTQCNWGSDSLALKQEVDEFEITHFLSRYNAVWQNALLGIIALSSPVSLLPPFYNHIHTHGFNCHLHAEDNQSSRGDSVSMRRHQLWIERDGKQSQWCLPSWCDCVCHIVDGQ